MKKTYLIKLTAAMAIDGSIRKAGSEVELDESLAKELLRRDRAVIVTDDVGSEIESADDEVDWEKLTKAQLQDVAAGLGVELGSGVTKAEIIAAIEGGNEE